MVKLANSNTEWLRKLSQELGIPYEKLFELYSKSGFNKEQLVNALKSEGTDSSNEILPKVVIFLNGMLIKDNFYGFEEEKNRNLLEMVGNNEFDLEIFEEIFGKVMDGEYVDLIVERRNENYCKPFEVGDNVKRKRMLSETEMKEMACIKERVLNGIPDRLYLGRNMSVKFKFIYKKRTYSMVVDPVLKIRDITEMFLTKFGLKVEMKIAGEPLDGNETVAVLKGTVVEVNDVK